MFIFYKYIYIYGLTYSSDRRTGRLDRLLLLLLCLWHWSPLQLFAGPGSTTRAVLLLAAIARRGGWYTLTDLRAPSPWLLFLDVRGTILQDTLEELPAADTVAIAGFIRDGDGFVVAVSPVAVLAIVLTILGVVVGAT